MSTQNRNSLRIVIQHVFAQHESSYRLVAYGANQIYRPLEFKSLDCLKKALHSVVPDFDESTLSIKTHESYIVFAGDVELNDCQLSALGLKDEAKS